MADRISESAGAQVIAEATGTDEEKKARTLSKVTIGPQWLAWDADDISEDQLATQWCEFQVFVPSEDGKSIVVEGWDVNGFGTFGLIIRRYVRDSEINDKRDVYLFFLDCLSRLETDLGQWMREHDRPRLKGLNRMQGPGFATLAEEAAQGGYIFATYMIPWGDLGGGDQ